VFEHLPSKPEALSSKQYQKKPKQTKKLYCQVPLADTCNPSYLEAEAEIKITEVQSHHGQIAFETLSQKYPIQKRVGRVAEVLVHLPSKPEALNSSLSTKQTKITLT
jgi:hypothetical protein